MHSRITATIPAAPGTYVIAIYFPTDPNEKPRWRKETVVAWEIIKSPYYPTQSYPVLLLQRDRYDWRFLHPTPDGDFFSARLDRRFATIEEGVEAMAQEVAATRKRVGYETAPQASAVEVV